MRVILTGGGTGGHVNPALAIADIIKTRHPDAEIIFIGTKRGIENRLVSKEGYQIRHVEARGLQRSLSPKNLLAAWYYVTSPLKARRIIKEFKPDIVIGTGGYVCYAPLKAAAKLGIPTMVHESNALPGLAVRMLQHELDRILINFDKSRESLETKDNVVTVGNPVRSDFGKHTKEEAKKELGISDYRYVILSYGGSLGAPAINEAALEVMRNFTASHPDILHIHSTGKAHYEEFMEKFRALHLDLNSNISVNEYVYDMPKKMAAADVIISRAGAMTVTEMSRMKKACIMIPSPHVADNHQYKNAKMLADRDAVVLVEEKDLDTKKMSEAVYNLIFNESARNRMGENIAFFAGNETEEKIYAEIIALVNKK